MALVTIKQMLWALENVVEAVPFPVRILEIKDIRRANRVLEKNENRLTKPAVFNSVI
jgi:hypothetical protein